MESLKVLFIGNSFAVDTTHYAAEVALGLGVKEVRISTLYVGGCSIDMHHQHALEDAPAYTFYTNCGNGWQTEEGISISEALKRDRWDWVAIQHGTHNGARYTDPKCYQNLSPLISYVKGFLPDSTKIAFNLTWLGEATYDHHEISAFRGDMAAMRAALETVTRDVVLANPLVDMLIPTGTAIENARTSNIGLLTRDGYHLSLDKGRYIAALTLVATLAKLDPCGVNYTPEGVDEYSKRVAVEAATNAIKYPLEVAQSAI